MASIEQRAGTYRIVFRYGGQKYSRSLKTKHRRAAELALAQLEDNLRRADLGTLTLPPDADVASVLLSSGKPTQRVIAPKRVLLGSILDQYLESIPGDAIEPKTRNMIKTRVKHLKRLMGVRTTPPEMTLERLQQYVNDRSDEPGIRGRQLSPVTVRKELTTLHAAWGWALESGLVAKPLPAKKRLRYGKEDEKPPFKTWAEIERIIKRSELTESEQRNYWDCLFLHQDEIAELLEDVRKLDREPFVFPMIATAAYTGTRRGELLRSRLEDVDLDANQMVIRERKRVRSKRSTRSVPISAALHTILDEWFDVHPGGPLTFTSSGNELTSDQAHCHFENSLAKTKWHVLHGWHVLRHSFISNCASKGIDQRIIDDWVGHQTDDMRRRYRHLFPNVQHQAMAAVFG